MTRPAQTLYSSIAQIMPAVIVPILCLVPFAGKAFHIDDTVFIWVAKHVQASPADFYGFTANWYGHEMPMSLINKNPPLVSYYIALVAYFLGWEEVILHLAFLIPAVAVSVGTYYLARPLCSWPYLASLIAVLTPVFLVSSTNVMSDTMMLAFYVWAIALWVHGLEASSSWHLLGAALAIALSALTHYFGMTLVPLLFIYSLMENRRLGRWVLFLVIPVLVLTSYQLVTYLLYGRGLISDAASYAFDMGLPKAIHLPSKIVTGLAFAGGCLATVGLYSPLLWSRRVWALAGLLLALSIGILLGLGSIGKFALRNAQGVRWGFLIQLSIFVVAGMHIFFLAAADFRSHRDAASLLLLLWTLGTLCFASFLNWTTTARAILPIVPAAGILVARRLDQRSERSKSYGFRRSLWPLLPSACLALAVTWADYSLANSQRSAARMMQVESKGYPQTLWFQGHWGFQYYMESFGAKAFDFKKSEPKQGDMMIIPLNNCNIELPHRELFHFVGKRQSMPHRWLATMQRGLGAGFYCDQWGPLPFAMGLSKPEEYLLFLVGASHKSAESIGHLRGSLRPNQTGVKGYNRLDESPALQEQIDSAISKTQEALNLHRGDPELHFKLGNLYRAKRKLDKAIDHYRKALQNKPNAPAFHNNLGSALEQKGNVKEALFHYSRAVELNGDMSEAHFNLGNVFARQDRRDKAIFHFSKALELKPGFAEAHNSLGVVLAAERRLDEAIASFAKALELKPDFGTARINLELARKEARQDADAEDQLKEFWNTE